MGVDRHKGDVISLLFFLQEGKENLSVGSKVIKDDWHRQASDMLPQGCLLLERKTGLQLILHPFFYRESNTRERGAIKKEVLNSRSVM